MGCPFAEGGRVLILSCSRALLDVGGLEESAASRQ